MPGRDKPGEQPLWTAHRHADVHRAALNPVGSSLIATVSA
jgi:hypothetical protein